MKNIYDCDPIKHVSAMVLMKDGKEAGKILASWSKNRAGSVCTAQVFLYNDRRIRVDAKGFGVCMIGKAGGYGYDKFSTAVAHALAAGGMDRHISVEAGRGTVAQDLRAAGYDVIEVI